MKSLSVLVAGNFSKVDKTLMDWQYFLHLVRGICCYRKGALVNFKAFNTGLNILNCIYLTLHCYIGIPEKSKWKLWQSNIHLRRGMCSVVFLHVCTKPCILSWLQHPKRKIWQGNVYSLHKVWAWIRIPCLASSLPL